MNAHIQMIKDSLAAFNTSVKAASEKMANNSRIYVPEEAKKANAAILEGIGKERAAARERIEEARTRGRSSAEAWGKLDGSQITDDAKLLEYGTLSPDQFSRLAEKYKDNATMSDMLLKYAKEKSTGGFAAAWNFSGRETAKPVYDTSMLHTREERAAAFDRAADQALVILQRIGNYNPRDMVTAPSIIDSSIETFGQGFEF